MLLLQERNQLPRSHANIDGIKPQLEKFKAISELKPPTNQKGVLEFPRMVGSYKKCINRFANAARTLTKFTKRNVKFDWPKIVKQV